MKVPDYTQALVLGDPVYLALREGSEVVYQGGLLRASPGQQKENWMLGQSCQNRALKSQPLVSFVLGSLECH